MSCVYGAAGLQTSSNEFDLAACLVESRGGGAGVS